MYVCIGSIIYIRYIYTYSDRTHSYRERYICICIDLDRTQSYRKRDVFISILTPIPVYVYMCKSMCVSSSCAQIATFIATSPSDVGMYRDVYTLHLYIYLIYIYMYIEKSIYSQLQIGWHKISMTQILRLLQNFQFSTRRTRILMGFIIRTIYYVVLIVNFWAEFWFVDCFLEIIWRFGANVSAIGCTVDICVCYLYTQVMYIYI